MTAKRDPQPPPEITIVLLNYRRPGNLPVILESIRGQTLRSVVFLWNNAPDDIELPGIDHYGSSGTNEGCMARWRMARAAETPWVMSLDDDLCFARDDALADVLESLRAADDPACIVGPVGCRLGKESSYAKRRDVYAGYATGPVDRQTTSSGAFEAVDMVKGRAMAFRRDRLEDLELPEEREDDIYLSAALAQGRRRLHRVPQRLRHAFRELPEHGVGNWKTPGHARSREGAATRYFLPVLTRTQRAEPPGSWRPCRRGEIVQRDGEELIIRLGADNGARLNPTAALIWERCDGRHTELELLAGLCRQFNVPVYALSRDLRDALQELTNIGALEPADDASANEHSGSE